MKILQHIPGRWCTVCAWVKENDGEWEQRIAFFRHPLRKKKMIRKGYDAIGALPYLDPSRQIAQNAIWTRKLPQDQVDKLEQAARSANDGVTD